MRTGSLTNGLNGRMNNIGSSLENISSSPIIHGRTNFMMTKKSSNLNRKILIDQQKTDQLINNKLLKSNYQSKSKQLSNETRRPAHDIRLPLAEHVRSSSAVPFDYPHQPFNELNQNVPFYHSTNQQRQPYIHPLHPRQKSYTNSMYFQDKPHHMMNSYEFRSASASKFNHEK
jgi:hypothetical protein